MSLQNQWMMKEKKVASAFQDPLSDQFAVGEYEGPADWTELLQVAYFERLG